jgi:Baseplate J-like protein
MEEATMDENLRQEIEELLEHLDAQENTSASQPDQGQQGAEVIDIFVVRRQVEEPEPPTVESTLAATCDGQEPQIAPTGQEPIEQETTEPPFPPLPRKPRRRALPFVVGALCVLVVGLLCAATLLIVLAPSATVTIIPASAQLTMTRTITVVPSNANAAQQQIPGRPLAIITLSQAKTVPTTGVSHQQAQAAHGLVTFYNALPAPQTIPAGEWLTGADGVAVVTLQDAVIPAGTLATNGQVTVPAQAVNAGPQGNIAANDLYGKCCRDNVFVSNGPFRGGQNARSYQMVTQQDISAVASSLKASLDQGVQAALSQQIHSNETLVTPVPCATTVTPDHQAGSEAAQVSITVSEICTREAYDTGALHDLLMQKTTQQAAKQLGEGYRLVGDFQTSIAQAMLNTRQGTATLQVKISSTWVYQFSQAQQDQIKLMIRGKSKDEAITLLLHMPGVQTVSISTKNGNVIPTDVQRIHLVFVEIM